MVFWSVGRLGEFCLSDAAWLPGAASGDARRRSPRMLSLDGLEMIAVLVVMGLFIKVLEQFGMFEPVGGEGKAKAFPSAGVSTPADSEFKGHACVRGRVGVFCCHFHDFSPSLLCSALLWSGRGAALSDGFGLPVQT